MKFRKQYNSALSGYLRVCHTGRKFTETTESVVSQWHDSCCIIDGDTAFAFSVLIGLGALTLMVALNLRHAANNYGILDNNLSLEVLAQTPSGGGSSSVYGGSDFNNGGSSNTGGNSSSNGGSSSNYNGWLWQHVKSKVTCTAKVTKEETIGIPPYVIKTTVESTVPGHYYECYDSWSMFSCSLVCKPYQTL